MSRALDRKFVLLLAFICAVCIGNLYVVQPLLAEMARNFGVDAGRIGLVATLAQMGYGLGTLLLVPFGDLTERRSLIIVLLGSVMVALVIAGCAPSVGVLCAASCLIGFTTVAPQVIVPYASSLAGAHERASVIGTVQSGLLIGILLARTVSGFVAAWAGWRAVYFAAAGVSVAMAILIRLVFPKQEAAGRMSYGRALHSMWHLLVNESALRRICLVSALGFAGFSAFWTTLAFLLESSFHLGPSAAGMFGVIGVVGAVAASVGGKMSDRHGTLYTQRVSLLVTLGSFLIFLLAAHSLAWLVVGVIVMDAGVQASHIACQAEAFALSHEARSRINGVYMFFRFAGGAVGSLLGAYAWNHGGWLGVCGLGILASGLALLPLRGLREPQALRS
ncbi:MAG: MFS transporter [Bdellovibrionales bacterium]|nr:MFS transporter [Bdellovibrionales bacterium]